jgi:Ser/Thr protein kinase RdoA (MazF antagonist)
MELSEFNMVAGRAATLFGKADWECSFIRQGDSATYKLERAGSETYLLRIHVPVTGAMGAHGADVRSVRSELLWLEALNRETDLTLPEPVRTEHGRLVARVALEGRERINCTLLKWVEGEPYHRDLESDERATEIGHTIAILHEHAAGWRIPPGFRRPSRDAAYFERALARLRPALADGRISRPVYTTLDRSIQRLKEKMASLDAGRQRHGLMHADAHKGNMLVDGGAIRLIDFSFCAFGNFMFDLGVCLSDMKDAFHVRCLAGYQSVRPLPEDYKALIEGFFVGSMVGTLSYWVENPRAQQLLVTRAPQMAREYAARYNRGESFWLS